MTGALLLRKGLLILRPRTRSTGVSAFQRRSDRTVYIYIYINTQRQHNNDRHIKITYVVCRRMDSPDRRITISDRIVRSYDIIVVSYMYIYIVVDNVARFSCYSSPKPYDAHTSHCRHRYLYRTRLRVISPNIPYFNNHTLICPSAFGPCVSAHLPVLKF